MRMDEEEETDISVEEVKIGSMVFRSDFREDVRIIDSALNNEFCHHAERFSKYATAYELASDVEARLKEELARVYAQQDYLARSDLKRANIKHTEKMVENTVITAPAYVEKQEEYLESKKNSGLLKVMRDAMIHRRDMLIQLGANYRAEGISDITLKTEAYKANR